MGLFKLHKDNVSLVEIELARLNECLKQSDSSQHIQIEITNSSPIYTVVEFINHLIDERQMFMATTLTNLDKTIQNLVKLTSIREMITNINALNIQLLNISAQAEELEATSNQVATSASGTYTFVEQASLTAIEGGHKIEQAIAFVEHSFDEFQKVSQQVQNVLLSMKQIEQIVQVIAGVADQTNLLALNAAIESARAGELGRGFAVVSDEVRKLAEHTKISVTDIRRNIVGLNQDSNATAKNIETLSQIMQKGKNVMQEAVESLQGMINNFGSITQDIHNIAASSEQQSASVEDTTKSVTTISIATEQIDNMAKVMGKGIYDISLALQKMRTEQLALSPMLDIHDTLELCKTDHLLWTWRIYNMLLGFEDVKANQVGNHHECRLGKWVNSCQSEKCRSFPVFKELEAPHKAVHDSAREAAIAFEEGNIKKAGQLLEQMADASKKVMFVLQELQKSC